MTIRPRLTEDEYRVVLNYRKNNEQRVLVIGDLHAPFIRDGYLDFCINTYHKYQCNKVVFIGDLIDNHYSSYHESDPDGHAAGAELDLAIKQIKGWYNAFNEADVMIGNHDAIPNRKAMTAGLSSRWIKPIAEVIEVPKWKFHDEIILDNNKYCHGLGRKAKQRAKDDFISVIQGHYHSESYVEYLVGERSKFFAMQVGCGVDQKAYAMAYGRNFKKMHINCGVVLENGQLPILEYMEL